MSQNAEITIGRIFLSYRNAIPDIYTFFFKEKDIFYNLDSEGDYYEQLGFQTTCAAALAVLEENGYTINFFSQLYDFFYEDSLQAFKQVLMEHIIEEQQSASLNLPDIQQIVEEYIAKHQSVSRKEELLDFIKIVQSLLNTNFNLPPFDRPYEIKRTSSQDLTSISIDAEIYFKRFSEYGFDMGSLGRYMLQHYKNFPHWIIIICLMIDPYVAPRYDFVYEYQDIFSFMFVRLVLEFETPSSEFKLEIAEVAELNAEDNPIEFLKQLHFDLTENIIRKTTLYNRMYKSLFVNEEDFRNRYIKSRATDLLVACDEALSTNIKGKTLEDLTELLFTSNSFMELVNKRVSTGDEEIDLVIKNNINRPFWLAFQSPLFFIECKNWKNPVGASELRNFEVKLRNHKLAKVGFFVALGGFTAEVWSELKRMGREQEHIVLIDRNDIKTFLDSDMDFFMWLESKTAKFY